MPRPRSDIRPRLVHAARARFLADGVDGASLRAIARDAGSNIGMIYYYFPTKDDLFLAVVEEVYVGLLADLTEALAPDVPVAERLRRALHRISRLSDDELDVVRLIVREALVSNERMGKVIERFQRGHLPLLMATMVEGREDGTFDRELPPQLLMMVTFMIGGVPQMVRRANDKLPPVADLPGGTELADLLHGLVMRAIGNA